MPLDSNQFFGPLSNAIDTIVAENIRGARAATAERVRGEQRDISESRFRRQGNLQHALSLSRSGKLTPESQKAVSASIGSIISDPNMSLQPDAVQFKQEPQFTTGQPEEGLGFESGTKIPLSKAGQFIKARSQPQKQTVPISDKVAKAVGLPSGQQVPVGQFDDIFRAYVSTLREQRLKDEKKQRGAATSDRDLAQSIDDTRQRLQSLEREAAKNPEFVDDTVKDELDELKQRHTDLIELQDKRLGREKPKADPKMVAVARGKISPFQKLFLGGTLSENSYKTQLRKLYKELGGDKKAELAIEAAMGF